MRSSELATTRADSERFVIAYQSEKSLHEVIAAPHIIASGFSPQNDTAEMLDPLEHAARSFEALAAAARGWPKLSHSPLGAYLECKVEDASESGKSTKPATSCP
jgi:hypothetical protein